MTNGTSTENKAILELQYLRNYREFVCIDNSLQCCNEIESCEDATVKEIEANQQETSEDQESV